MADNEEIIQNAPEGGDNTGAEAPVVAGENTNAEPQAAAPTFDEQLKAWAKEKGREIENPEDLFVPVEKIIEKEVNPFAELMDEEDNAYFKFKKETGRSRDEYNKLKANWDEVPALDLARERVRRETGLTSWSDDKIDEYLEGELNIDLSDIDSRGEIKLAGYVKSLRDEKKAEQQKYALPAENKIPQPAQPGQNDERVELPNGTTMSKSAYDQAVAQRQKFTDDAKKGVNSVTSSSVDVVFDVNGEKVSVPYTYEISDEDRSSAGSMVTDLDAVIARHGTENGFDHPKFAENVLWGFDKKFREKAIASMIHKAVAQRTEEILAQRGNVNFSTQPDLQKQNREGVKIVAVSDLLAGNV